MYYMHPIAMQRTGSNLVGQIKKITHLYKGLLDISLLQIASCSCKLTGMVSVASIVLAAIAVLLCSSRTLGQREPPNHCIEEGGYHKKAPSPETEEFAACQLWQSNSCCTPETTRRQDIGSSTISMCGQLSARCQAFMQVSRYECNFVCA